MPPGYVVDHNRERLGTGSSAFGAAVSAVREWKMFDVGWVDLIRTDTPVEVGANVAILVNRFGFWFLNSARIVYVIEEQRRFGFAYGTLEQHAEQGEERFSVEWDSQDDSVFFDILAFSKPRLWAARVALPLTRGLQKKFARDSMAAMQRAVRADSVRSLGSKPRE
jgi:uncharacterized protein (UPF0548 family)